MLTWWQGDISVHGFGSGRRRDRRRHVHGHRARARRQRAAGGPARVPAHAAGYRADHGVRPDPVQPLIGGRPRLRRGHGQRLPGDRRQDRPGDVRMDEHRPRRAQRILRTGESLDDGLPVRLLPPQLDQRRPRRQPADLQPQHVDRLQARRCERPDRVAPGGQAQQLQDGPRHGHRLAARPARTAERLDQRVRQRRLAEGPRSIARHRREPSTSRRARPRWPPG